MHSTSKELYYIPNKEWWSSILEDIAINIEAGRTINAANAMTYINIV